MIDEILENIQSALINFENYEKACFNQSPMEHPFYKIAKKQLELGIQKFELFESTLVNISKIGNADVPHGTTDNDKPEVVVPMERNVHVNHPSHYNQGKIEVIDMIEHKEMDFHLGNALKYVARAGKKDPKKYIEDLEKALWYIERKKEDRKHSEINTFDFVVDQKSSGPVALVIKGIVDANEQLVGGDGNTKLFVVSELLKVFIASEKAKKA